MKKRILSVAGATVLALSMSFTAMADVVTSDVDYGTAGQAGASETAWNSALNGQFAIEDGQSITFTFDSKGDTATNIAFGWVSEITDGTSYFTMTQAAGHWYAPEACDWVKAGDNTAVVETNWKHDDPESAEYKAFAEAAKDLKGTVLVVTRSGNQVVFDATQKGADGTEYKTKVTGVWGTAPTGTLKVQLGVDHGSMVLYSAKYGEAGQVEEVETEAPTEKVTLKVNTQAAGVSSNDSADTEEEGNSSTTMIIVVVAVVLVIAVAGAVVVATKKKNN